MLYKHLHFIIYLFTILIAISLEVGTSSYNVISSVEFLNENCCLIN